MFLTDKNRQKLLVTLSVRTCFGLLLKVLNFLTPKTLNFPNGTHILTTAMNIPDMTKIIRFNGLIPVPIDLSSKTLAPTVEDVKKIITKDVK
jgi:dTDP-4-amino-4,6-dideoxygalactose transaminase